MPRDINMNMYFNINQRSVQKSVGTFAKFEKTLATLGYRAARTSALLDRHIVDPLKRIAQAAVDSSATLYRSLGEVQTLLVGSLTETTARMESFKSDMRVLSIEVVKDMNDLTKGLYEYISAFQELPNTMEGFTIAAKVARAGITSTKQAVDLLSSVSLAYGDTSTATQQKIADLSFETVRLAKTHIPELAANVSKVAPIFAIMGLEMEQLFGVASTLIGITGDTTEVFTQMRRVVLSMQKPNQTMVKLLNALGYSGAFAGKELLKDDGLVGAIKQLNTQAGEMGISIEKAVGRIQGIMPVLAFQLQSVQDRYESVMLSINKPGGATESALEKAIDGIATNATRLDRAKLALENIGRKLGDRLLPLLSRFYDLIVAMLEKLLSKQSFPTLERLLAQIGWLTTAIGDLSEGWTRFLTNVVVGSVVVSPALGMFAVLLFSIETSITLARGAFKLFMGTLRGVIKLLRIHNGLMNNLRFQYGRLKFQMRELRLGWEIATAEGLKGIKRIKAAISLGGVKGTLLALVPWVLLAAAIAGAIVLAVKLNKHFRNKAIAKYMESADDAIYSFEKLAEATTNYSDALTDVNAITDVFEQKLGFIALLMKKEAELLSVRGSIVNLREELAEYQEVLDKFKPTPIQNKEIAKLAGDDWMETAVTVSVGAEATGAKAAIFDLQVAIIKANVLIRGLVTEISNLKLDLLPEAEANVLKKQIEDIVGDFTFSSGAFEIDVVLGVADLNRINDLLGIEINPLAESFDKIANAIVDVKFKAVEADAELERLNQGIADFMDTGTGDPKMIEAMSLQIQSIEIYKKAIVATLAELQKYFNISEALSEETATFATAFLAVTQDMNKYSNAIADNITIQAKLNDKTIPEDVKQRLRFMLDANNELITSYEEQLWLLEAKASVPEGVSGLASAEAIVMKVKESNKSIDELTTGLDVYEKVLVDMFDNALVIPGLDIGEVQQIIAAFKEALGSEEEITLEPVIDLTSVEQGLENALEAAVNYNEALALLSADTTKFSDDQVAYLENIVESYKRVDLSSVQSGLASAGDDLRDYNEVLVLLNGNLENYTDEQLAYLNGIVDSFEEAGKEALALKRKLEGFPKAIQGLQSVKDIVEGIREETVKLNELKAGLAFYEDMFLKLSTMTLTDTDMGGEEIYAIIIALREALGITDDSTVVALSAVGQGLANIKVGLADYNEALDALSGDTTTYSLLELDYLNGIVDGYEDKVKALKNVERIMNKMSAKYKGMTKFEEAWVAYNEEIEEAAANNRALLKAQDDLDLALMAGDDTQANFLSHMIDGLMVAREETEKLKGGMEELGKSELFSNSVFKIEIEETTNKLSASWGDEIQNAIDGTSSWIDALIAVALSFDGVQEVVNDVMNIFGKLFEILGPAIGNLLEPLIDVFGGLFLMLGKIILPLLEVLVPVFHMLAVIAGAILVPALMILAPIISLVSAVFEVLMPIIGLVAKAIIIILSPLTALGEMLTWAADTIKVGAHNLSEWLQFWKADKDYWAAAETVSLEDIAAKIQAQLDAVDAAMETGIGNEEDKITDDPSYYEDLYNTALEDITNPLAGDEGGSGGGSGANIKQMTQHNYITVNTGALVGSNAFDEFVMIVTRRLNELKEVV